ncbi:hypothetical protein MRX96_035287 [Rhipicephalus microplus]
MAVPAEPATFAVTFSYMNVVYNKRWRHVEVAFDMPDEQFGRRFRLSRATGVVILRRCRHGLAGCALGGAAKVCAPRFFVTGSFQSSVRGKETVAVMQPKVSICVRSAWLERSSTPGRATSGFTSRKWRMKAAAKEEFLWVGPLPSVIGYVDGSFVASRSEQAPFWLRRLFCSLRHVHLRRGDADSRLGPASIGDDGYPLEHWLVVLAKGRPYKGSAEVKYNSAHASLAFRSGALYCPPRATEEPFSLRSAAFYPPLLTGTFFQYCCCMCSVAQPLF